ncbi:MAG: hypothetical protein M1833_005909 [Piccolia ochrophora]|nr:MAG: hypothetical protein M1833_005909 [Piccolia ochrophora]
MVHYRSISLSLISQFDILSVPELAPPENISISDANTDDTNNEAASTVDVYIPTYPLSQFWLAYTVSPPHPPGVIYYFKLYLNDIHVVSWGTSRENGYSGKTMFGLFDGGQDWTGEQCVERHVLCFGDGQQQAREDIIEVRVFRAKGRVRLAKSLIERVRSRVNKGKKSRKEYEKPTGIRLVNAGIIEHNHPQNYYKYALIDRLDQPFATFRFHCKTWGRKLVQLDRQH